VCGHLEFLWMALALYTPYRAVGFVSDGIPFVVNQLGDESFLLQSIGHAFQVLLNLVVY
jgi:hypothetical protein